MIQVSSINRVLRNTINNHIEHKYEEHEQHQQYGNETSDGSEEEDAQNAYQPKWQPPNQIDNSIAKGQNILNENNARLDLNEVPEQRHVHRHSMIIETNQDQNISIRLFILNKSFFKNTR